MRWSFLFVLIASGLWAAQIGNRYDNESAISFEFSNVYQTLQDKQFRVFKTTPALNDLMDREMVIFSSGAVKIMWRENQEIYAVTGSCVTVNR